MSLSRRVAALLVATTCCVSHGARAQQLGTLTFPTSGGAVAQQHFVRGTLYLHSFEYESALREFREAERLEPTFAMAYWGDAMTWTHPVWNQQNADSARAALARLGPTPAARLARAPTAREKAFVGAVEVLYGAGSKASRDTAYAAAMERVAAQFPADDEAQLFQALAVLGLNQGERDVPAYMRAGAIAQRVFQRRPGHPGAAHYVIHAFDDPTHAALGLDAARAYSRIAPDAAHAQHMTSHIFLALGLWDDLVTANEVALKVMRTHRTSDCGHYAEWLEYGYLQQGRLRDAAATLDACWKRPSREGSTDEVEGLAGFRAAWIVDSHQWSGKYVEEPPATRPDTRVYVSFGTGYAAVMRGDRATASRALASVEASAAGVTAANRPYAAILATELRALVAVARGDSVRGLELVRAAARSDDSLPMPFGPPLTIKPPHELAGELLLAMGRHADARQEFRLALARTPLRPAAVLGLARAEQALGRSAEATAAYGQLLLLWHRADADLPDLSGVRSRAGGPRP